MGGKMLLFVSVLVGGLLWTTAGYGQDGVPDVSAIIYQQNINKLMGMMGPISGKTRYSLPNRSGELSWEVRNPRIEIGWGSAKFVADTSVKPGFMSSSPQVVGKVDVQYDAKRNKILVTLSQVGFDAYLDLFGNRPKIASIDLSSYFKQGYEFDGPILQSKAIEIPVSEYSTKIVHATPGVANLVLEPGKIVLSVPVEYAEAQSVATEVNTKPL